MWSISATLRNRAPSSTAACMTISAPSDQPATSKVSAPSAVATSNTSRVWASRP
jgi:hypothetical protein